MHDLLGLSVHSLYILTAMVATVGIRRPSSIRLVPHSLSWHGHTLRATAMTYIAEMQMVPSPDGSY